MSEGHELIAALKLMISENVYLSCVKKMGAPECPEQFPERPQDWCDACFVQALVKAMSRMGAEGGGT